MSLLLLRLPQLALLLGRTLHISNLNAVLLPRWARWWAILHFGRHHLLPGLLWWSLPRFICLNAKACLGEQWREVFVEDGLSFARVCFRCVLLDNIRMTLYLDAFTDIWTAEADGDPLPVVWREGIFLTCR